MAGDVQRPPTRPPRSALGERLAGFIYGTIIVLAVVVAGARAFPDDAARIAALAGATSLVFWVAHVYAHSIAHSVAHDEHLSLAALRRIARREASILEAAVPPIAALLLGAVGVLSASAAVWAAFGLGLAVLVAQGLRFARAERLGWLGTIGVVAANLALAGMLVALKLVL